MDEFLEGQGLWRKHIPRDGSCLFRAVSEQVYHTQVYHSDVRRDCIQLLTSKKDLFQAYVDGNYEDYLANLSNPKVWAGHLEIAAMSLLFRMDFAVFEEIGQGPTQVTRNSFHKTVMLCYSQCNHYDLVYQKEQLDTFAFCQALVYGLLYKGVFGLGSDVDYAVKKMLYDKAYSKKKKSLALPHFRIFEEKQDKCRIQELVDDNVVESGGGGTEEASSIRELLSQGCPPFPYKVAKALDPDIYRNVEYDRWNQARREQERAEQLVVPDFAPGVKCLVRLMENQTFHAHIQEMSPDQGPVTVYIEELGEKKIIPFDHLQPLAIPVYKALAMQGFHCKKSIRLLDGYLKNSHFVSLSSLVTDGLRNGRKYLKKKTKEVPFLLPVMEKNAATLSPKSSSGSTHHYPSWPLGSHKASARYIMDKVKVAPSASKEEKQAKKSVRSMSESSAVKSRQQPKEHGLEIHPSSPVSKTLPPAQPQEKITTPFDGGRGNGPDYFLPPPHLPSQLGSNALAYPCQQQQQPYPMMGGPFPNAGPPTFPITEFPEFGRENQIINSGLAVDPFGNPYFFTLGTFEMPFFPPSNAGGRPMPGGGGGGSNPAELLAGPQPCMGPTSTAAAGGFGSSEEPAAIPSGPFWTYNGSYTYLPAPANAAPLLADGCEWAMTTDDPHSPGFAAMTPGVPLFFFMSPPPLNPGLVNNTNSYMPSATNQ